MCGIVGVHNLNGTGYIPEEPLRRMIGIINHRGPDEAGLYRDSRTALGHARLSIIDLGSGTQPMHNEDETVWITFNGEIFNYPELREQLLLKGHKFATTSDTEVLIHLYEEKGESLLDDIIGQFAFAIWDTKKRELFAARDRVGIRPFYYTLYNNTLVFASEIKAIFEYGPIERAIDVIALDQICTFWTTLNERTVFENIRELPPGHYMKVVNGVVTIKRYWDIPLCPEEEKLDWSEDRITENIIELLTDAIRIRLRADVEVGAYLSGGLDSSGVSSIIKRNFNNELHTFGIRFEEAAFDEGVYQKNMVDFLGVDHKELFASNSTIFSSLPDVVWHCEKPLLRTAPVPLFLLSGLVRDNGLKVVLTGEGADEIFGGYNIFRENKVRRFWAEEPDSTFRFRLLEQLYPYIARDKKAGSFLKNFFGRDLRSTDNPLYSHMPRWSNTSRIKYFFSDKVAERLKGYNGYSELIEMLPENFERADSFSKAQYLETHIFMSNYLLSSQGDRVAMAHSLEIRLPFLDHRLIEFMARIPAKWKIKGMKEKYILKKALSPFLPASVAQRTKHPFRAPVNHAFISDNTRAFLLDTTEEHRDVFDAKKIVWFLDKLSKSATFSETDSMAVAAILTTRYLTDSFMTNTGQHALRPISLKVNVDNTIQK